jgi:hypothetical protein
MCMNELVSVELLVAGNCRAAVVWGVSRGAAWGAWE